MNRRLRSAFIPQRRASSSGPATRLLMTSCVYKEKRWRVPERLGWPEQRSKLTVETDEQQGEVRSWRRLTVMNAAPRQKPITADTPGDYFLNPHSPSSSQPLLSPPLLLPSSSLYTHSPHPTIPPRPAGRVAPPICFVSASWRKLVSRFVALKTCLVCPVDGSQKYNS